MKLPHRFLLYICLTVIFEAIANPVWSAPITASTIEAETLAKIGQLRAISTVAGSKPTAEYNNQMDATWKFFNKNKNEVLPILARELEAEMANTKPSDLVLLDIGYFLAIQNNDPYKKIAKRALFTLTPSAEVIQWNFQELFNFTYGFADDRDPKMLEFFDKVFLTTDKNAFVPQHAMTLDGTLMCVFLYGKYGPESEVHLRRLLADPKLRNRVIEILVWIGSAASLSDIKGAMAANRDHETFLRATAFMMGVGGPDGRAVMLGTETNGLAPKSKEYFNGIAQAVKESSFDTACRSLKSLPGYKKLTDEQVQARLQAMYKNFGKDVDTHPMAIVNSGLSKNYLISELIKIRARMLYRLSNEALDDVQITNALMNALRYRPT